MEIPLPQELQVAIATRMAKRSDMEYDEALGWVDHVARLGVKSPAFDIVAPFAVELMPPLIDVYEKVVGEVAWLLMPPPPHSVRKNLDQRLRDC